MFSRLPKSLLFFWVVQVGVVSIIWNLLANEVGGFVLILLIALNSVLLAFRQIDLPLITNVAMVLCIANFWVANGNLSPLGAAIAVVLGVMITGFLCELTMPQGVLGPSQLTYWLLLALMTAEANSLIGFWPVTFLQKTILATAVFYFFWQLISLIETSPPKQLRGHFVFVGLAVIVIVASIAWSTWPGLKTF